MEIRFQVSEMLPFVVVVVFSFIGTNGQAIGITGKIKLNMYFSKVFQIPFFSLHSNEVMMKILKQKCPKQESAHRKLTFNTHARTLYLQNSP